MRMTNGISFAWNWGCISKMKRSLIAHTPLLLLGTIAWMMASCDLDKAPHNFPHQPHHEQEISCEDCHEMGETEISLPTFETCVGCHDLEDEIFDRCRECHKKHDVEMEEEKLVSHRKVFQPFMDDRWQDVRYNHGEFLDDESDCLECHAAIPESTHSSTANLPTMAAMMRVHERLGLSTDCQACHLELDLNTPPASHTARWEKTHGRNMIFEDKDTCLLCHEEETCFTCHSTSKPRNHTNLWRRKTHGIQASFDRSSCMTCHRTDECTTCHLATADPIPAAPYHVPDMQCILCHYPQGSNLRAPSTLYKIMPHRMMMGATAQKCLQCHQF